MLAAVLLTAAVGMVAGAVLAPLSSGETPDDEVPAEVVPEMPGDDSVEAGFARDMIIHHAQAVEMAEIARTRTGSEYVRNLASDIALAQQAEIGQMRGWLQVWDLSPTDTNPAMDQMGGSMEGMRMPGMASPEEIDELNTLPPEEMDILFLKLMIAHHEAAIPMAKAVLKETDRPEVEQLATAIVASQQAEISKIQNLLRSRGVSVQGPSMSESSYGND